MKYDFLDEIPSAKAVHIGHASSWRYTQILRQWFKTKLSREDFDHEARKLMSPETVHLHNQFLLCIMAKCQALGSSLVRESSSVSSHSSSAPSKQLVKKIKSKRKSHYSSSSSKSTFQQRFVAADPMSIAPQIQAHIPEQEERGPGYVSREQTLPDLGMVHGRLIVSAWDYGMDDVQDDATRLLMYAVEHHLKTILTAVLIRRNGYKVRDGRFKHSVGVQVPPPHVRNTILVQQNTSNDSGPTSVTSKGIHMPALRPSMETADRDAAVQMALSQPIPMHRGRVSLYDCFEALQCNKSAIPSHTVYTNCMERIVHRLWHPSSEEIQAHRNTVLKSVIDTGPRQIPAKS